MTPALATLSPPRAESHPLDESTLCRRLDGHSGTHQSDGTAAWVDVDEPDPDRRTQ